MAKIKVKVGKEEKEFEKGITAHEVAEQMGKEDALAVKLDDTLKDLSTNLTQDSKLKFITFEDDEGIEVFRHSTAHLMAHAVKILYPQAKNTIGPVVEEGFYYDFDSKPFHPKDLKQIEKKMHEIMKQKLSFERVTLTKSEAKKMFKDNKYKLELIEDFEGEITAYKQGDFVDLCRGPHVPHTGYLKAFKLTKIAGAYWKGDKNNEQLQRIYGISFPKKEDLKEYLKMREEAIKRDHRKLGKELKLYSFHDEALGFPFWHPKGLVIFNKLIEFWRTLHKEAGYVEIKTPILLSKMLWEKSGHWENYRENMYITKIDEEEYAVKPMNCPGGMLMYKEHVHSYKEMPMRVGEIGLVHRHELSGVLAGLFRVRQFHQDDAHIFMTEDQITEEILGVIKLVDKIYSTFGLTYHMELSTRPEKSIGTDEAWEMATDALKQALIASKKEYKINEGDGAFYGPKIDFHIKDAIGRTWQCATIQLDMSLPERFDLTYMGEDGQNIHRPIMIHRTIYGAIERFLGIIIEHYAGKLPLWLNPVQVKVLTVADRFEDYALTVKKELEKHDIRVEVDSRSESIGYKVRQAQMEKINYILVVGEKEAGKNLVAVRTRNNEVLGEMQLKEFVDKLVTDIRDLK